MHRHVCRYCGQPEDIDVLGSILPLELEKMMAAIDDIKAAVLEATTVEQGVAALVSQTVVLLQSLSSQLTAAINSNDTVALENLVTTLNKSSNDLSSNLNTLGQAVVANTPTPSSPVQVVAVPAPGPAAPAPILSPAPSPVPAGTGSSILTGQTVVGAVTNTGTITPTDTPNLNATGGNVNSGTTTSGVISGTPNLSGVGEGDPVGNPSAANVSGGVAGTSGASE